MTTCTLCGSHEPLRLSHLIPKFVFDRMKRESVTGRFVLCQARNSLVQDGIRTRLLCGTCEQRFSLAEGAFARSIFHPYIDGKLEQISCKASDTYFAASLTWRSLVYTEALYDHGIKRERPLNDRERRIRGALGNYLLGRRPHPPDIRHYLLAFRDDAPSERASIALLYSAAAMYAAVHSGGTVVTTHLTVGLCIVSVIADGLLEWPSESRIGLGRRLELTSRTPSGWQDEFFRKAAQLESSWKDVPLPKEAVAQLARSCPPTRQSWMRARATKLGSIGDGATLEFCFTCFAPLLLDSERSTRTRSLIDRAPQIAPHLKNVEALLFCTTCAELVNRGALDDLERHALESAKSPKNPNALSKQLANTIRSRVGRLRARVVGNTTDV